MRSEFNIDAVQGEDMRAIRGIGKSNLMMKLLQLPRLGTRVPASTDVQRRGREGRAQRAGRKMGPGDGTEGCSSKWPQMSLRPIQLQQDLLVALLLPQDRELEIESRCGPKAVSQARRIGTRNRGMLRQTVEAALWMELQPASIGLSLMKLEVCYIQD
jgi:hypothetical protein